jgi:hypothetical protein
MGPADTATYGRAKERTGKATSSALKGLRETLASRGLLGSGIEASETGKVFSSGLSDLAETNRQMAERGAQRDYEASQAQKDRDLTAAREGLQAAMSTPGTVKHLRRRVQMGQPGWMDPNAGQAYDEMDFSARNAAVAQARQQLQALTGYSMPSGGAGMY